MMIEDVDAHLDITSTNSGTWGSAINFREGNTSTFTNSWTIARTTGSSPSLHFNFGTANDHNINGTKVRFTSSGQVYATSFHGSIDYSDITNPPVIDNSVDYINSASFNTTNGVLTLSGVGRAGATVDLDGRYELAHSHPYLPLAGGSVTGNITLNNSADLIFRDKNGTFPTNSGRFVWDLNNDSASIYAQQPSSDHIDFFFKITDNAGSTDRFVFWIDDYRGSLYDKYPAQLDGTGVHLSVPVSASGTKDLSNARMKIPYTGNPTIDNNTIWHAGNLNPNDYLLAANYVDDYVTSASFNTTNGVLTLTRAEGGTVTVDLDGRYLQTETDSQTLSWNGTNGQLSISNGNTVDLDGRYLQSFSETDTLDSVTTRGNTTDNDISTSGSIKVTDTSGEWSMFTNSDGDLVFSFA